MSGARNRALLPASGAPPAGKNYRGGAGGRSPDLRAPSGGALACQCCTVRLTFNDEGSGTNEDCFMGRQSTFSEASEQRNSTGRQFEQSQQRQESRIVKFATQSDSTSSEVTRKYEYSKDDRTRARKLTLASCELALRRTDLGWYTTQFRRLVQHHPPRKNALCSRRIVKDKDKPKEYVEGKLNSDDHIAQRKFEAIQPDPAFTEMMSSAQLDEPDGRAVEEAMVRVTAEAEEYVQMERETLIKSASMAPKTGAYAGLAQLHVMGSQQRIAYNQFAPLIAAPPIHEESTSDAGYD
ncbi:hypothetical protein C8F01DRAFT_1085454 [Mycena amicta]|nr:hypothetical protein C8F01DRAFT_1085454 [Mycena amicta]